MTLLVETGDGLEGAESYISVADADEHHALYGNEGWLDFSDDEKEILLRRASRDIDILYGSRYDSVLLSTTQGLLWPRRTYTNAVGYSISGLPSQVKAATAELALILGTLSDAGPLAGSILDANSDEDANVQSFTKSIDGVGSVSKTYFGPGHNNWDSLSRVTLLLRPLLGVSSARYARVVRG
jgi:hypothetical protein